jgi:hypothetical protein
MALLGTYYLNAPSLSSATSVYTDAALTIVGPDGWYSDGTIVRELVSGVFTNIISSCTTCASDCSSTPVTYIGDRAFVEMYKDTGGAALDVGAVIVEVEQAAGFEIPSGFFFEYNGVYYNTISTTNYGLLQGPAGPSEPIYIGESSLDCGIVAAGLQSVPVYNYNPVTDAFDNTGQFTSIQALAPQVQLTGGPPGKGVFVIPKTTPSPNLVYFQGIFLCGTPSTNEFSVTVKCPANLPRFTSTVDCANDFTTCITPTDQIYYSADVNGTTAIGGTLGLNDWVFSDSFGQNVLPNGWYRSPSLPVGSTAFEVQNGIIASFSSTPCVSVIEWNVDYEVENAISGSCAVNVSLLELTMSQPPLPPFLTASAPSTGLSVVSAGITRIRLQMDWVNTYSPCGQVKMVIERDNVIIAFRTFTPTVGTEFLEVDINVDADSDIYAYVTLA